MSDHVWEEMCVMQCENTQVTLKKQTCLNWKVLFRASWLTQKLSWQVKIFVEVSIQHTKNTPPPPPLLALFGVRCGVMWQPSDQVLHAGQHTCGPLSLWLDMQVQTIQHAALWEASTSRNSLRSAMLSFCKQPPPKVSSFTQDTSGFFIWLCCLFCTSNSSWLSTHKESSLSVFHRINKNKMANIAVDLIRSV